MCFFFPVYGALPLICLDTVIRRLLAFNANAITKRIISGSLVLKLHEILSKQTTTRQYFKVKVLVLSDCFFCDDYNDI